MSEEDRVPDLPTPIADWEADYSEATLDDLFDKTVPAIDLAPPAADVEEATVPQSALDEPTAIAEEPPPSFAVSLDDALDAPSAPIAEAAATERSWGSPDGTLWTPQEAQVDAPPPWTFDVHRDAWVADHRPTYTVAALPMMVLADRIAAAAHFAWPDRRVVALENVGRCSAGFAPIRPSRSTRSCSTAATRRG